MQEHRITGDCLNLRVHHEMDINVNANLFNGH